MAVQRRPPDPEDHTDRDLEPALELDRRLRFLHRCIADTSRRARQMADVSAVADAVWLVKNHRPLVVDIVSTTTLDGDDPQQVTFQTGGGNWVSALAPRILCQAHQEAEHWPCHSVRAFARSHAERSDYRPDDWLQAP
jgi:hypothetical protein